jgi:hypothetical protein
VYLARQSRAKAPRQTQSSDFIRLTDSNPIIRSRKKDNAKCIRTFVCFTIICLYCLYAVYNCIFILDNNRSTKTDFRAHLSERAPLYLEYFRLLIKSFQEYAITYDGLFNRVSLVTFGPSPEGVEMSRSAIYATVDENKNDWLLYRILFHYDVAILIELLTTFTMKD